MTGFDPWQVWRAGGWCFVMLGVVTPLILPATSLRSLEESTPAIRPEAPYQGSLQRGDELQLRWEVETPGLWRVSAKEGGIDVELVVRDPSAREIGHVTSPFHRKGRVRWSGQLETSGTYLLELRALESTAPRGEVTIEVEDLTRAEPGRIEAELAMTVAAGLEVAGTREARRSARAAYREALPLWRQLGVRERQAETLYALGLVGLRLGEELSASRASLEEAAGLFAQLDDPLFEASVLADLGLVLRNLGELSRAETSLRRAVELLEAIDEPFGGASALNTLCMIEHSRGELRKALGCYGRAVEMARRAEATGHAAAFLNNLGYAYDGLGEPRRALDHYRQAMEIRRRQGDRAGEAQVLNNMAGVVFRGEGDGERALAYYESAREIYAELGQERQLAAVFHNQGETYRRLGNPERALVYLRRARQLRRRLEDPRGEMVTLNAEGLALWQQGALEEARTAHEEALALARRIERRRGEGLALAYLGRIAVASGETSEGLERFEEAARVLAEVEDPFHVAWARQERGSALLAVGDLAGAEAELRRALELRRRVTDRAGEVETLEMLARTTRARGQLPEASQLVQAALAIVEELQEGILGPEIRMTFLARRASVFETAIAVLMDRHRAEPGGGYDVQAFEVSERSRARALLELVSPASVADRSDLSLDGSVRGVREDLERRLRAKAARLTSLRGRGRFAGAEVETLETEIETILTQLDVAEAEARRQESGVASAPGPPLAELQRALGSDTVLLEYSLGEERSFLWRLDDAGLETFELPGRGEIEPVARSLHQAWGTPGRRSAGRDETLALALSHLVLAPVWDRLEGRRVAVVGDGALHHVPFAALPIPARDGGWRPLLVASEVVRLPSLSVLVRQRRSLAGREPAPGSLAVLGDPVYEAGDARLASSGATAPGRLPELARSSLRSAWREAAGPLPRLPSSRREALRIAEMAPPGEVWLALDLEADRHLATDGRLQRFRTIHFATHGLVLEDRPELSGLALSMVDRQRRPVDGFLRLRDVYALDLAAELVVLSGCRTALGRGLEGEGMVGLARAFQSAGASRVVATLWRIQDRATARLMAGFYRGLWQENLSSSAALRRAQLEMLEGVRFRDPFFWAAFVHQGDWR